MSAEKGNNIPILTQNLTKRYGRILALDNLCLRVEAGQVYGLLGPNGAGKTTTLRLLLGLARPTAGAAWLFGLPCGTAASRRPGVVGALVDEPAFYPYLTGRQNLEILCDLSGAGHDEIGEALAAVGLAHAADRLYQTYSHGMRQRLGIAAALVPRPRLLVLDEPAAGLDPQGLRDVRELLRRLAADGMTVLLSSHLLPEVQILCTHVGLMFGGRLVASGPVSQLLRDQPAKVSFQVDDPVRARQIAQALGATAAVSDDGSLDATLEPDAVAELNAALVRGGIRVYAIVPQRRSLEDLYMEYASSANNGKGNNR